MKLKDYKHDINGFIFKMETASHLLDSPESLSPEEIKLISRIIKENTDRIKLFIECFTLLEKLEDGELKPEKTPLNPEIPVFFNDTHLTKTITEAVKAVNKADSLNTEIKNNRFVFKGNFEPKNQLDRFFIIFLENILKPYSIKISSREIKLEW
ncbi:hypothetical protein [Persephonella sp.]